MPIPTTNVSFSAIQTEFGGSNPIALSEYYRGGSNVPSNQPNAGYGLISTSGAISVGPFRGQTKVAARTYNAANFMNFTGQFSPTSEEFVQLRWTIDGVTWGTLSNGSSNFNWTTPSTINIGNTHWIRVDITNTYGGNGTFTGTTGVWLQMNTDRTYRFSQTKPLNSGLQYKRSVRVRYSTSSTGTPVVADGTSIWTLI